MSAAALQLKPYAEEHLRPSQEPWEARRRRIALQVREACDLADNAHGPDMEAFIFQYGLHSDFA